MGYRLYVREKGSTGIEECFGGCYGYEGAGYSGAIWLYENFNDMNEWVEEYWYSIDDLKEKLMMFFDCSPYFEIELTGSQLFTFLSLYSEDQRKCWGRYNDTVLEFECDYDKNYILEWF